MRVLIGFIRLYQIVLSPLLPKSCRFVPTCSDYTIEAIRTHGPLKGTWLGIKRIARCNPFNRNHGLDPVPSKNDNL